MRVVAIVPHWNRSDLLGPLLRNLAEQTRAFDEVMVVDNGSADDSVAVAEAGGALVVRLAENLGFAAAVNRGIQATQSDWVAILNNDVALEPDWLDQLLKADAWFATGKILSATDDSRIDGTFDEISRGACALRCGAGRLDGPFWNQTRNIRMAPMTAAVFRRSLFEEIGFLDESFGSYLEDVDFGLRCALAGRGGMYVPTAVARHQGSATSGAWRNNTVRLIARNQMLLGKKHFQGQFLWARLAGQLLWGLVALRHGAGWAYLTGKWAGWWDRIAPYPSSTEKVRSVVLESERQILDIQRQTGFDGYWRAYFWLSPPS